jgi:hypothetical protein
MQALPQARCDGIAVQVPLPLAGRTTFKIPSANFFFLSNQGMLLRKSACYRAIY